MLGFSETYVYISLNQIYFFILALVTEPPFHFTQPESVIVKNG